MFFIFIYQLLEKCGHNASTKQYSVKSIFLCWHSVIALSCH